MKKIFIFLILPLAVWACAISCENKETINPSYITVTTDSIINICETGATILFSIVPNNEKIKEMGVCYGSANNPNILDNKMTISESGKNQSLTLSDLTPNNQYYVRAFASTEKGVYYGKELSFITNKIVAPQVKTNAVSDIKERSARCALSLISNGGDDNTRAGLLLAEHTNPTFGDRKISLSAVESASIYVYYLEPGKTYYVKAFAINQADTAYGDELSFTTLTPKEYIYTTGVIHGAFSVSASKVVGFSIGNLQYTASTKVWSFAEKQYEVCGNNNKSISSTYSKPIDLFGYGTSGYSYNPWSTSTNVSSYPTANIDKTNSDWGVNNAISNGGDVAGLWRTLSYSEWNYLINKRQDASKLTGLAVVNSVNGLILLPDNWENITGISFTPSRTNFVNSYSTSEFAQLESAGAVFLPLCGIRYQTQLMETTKGLYWSSSYTNSKTESGYAVYLGFSTTGITTDGTIKTCAGLSVRLVQDLVEKQQ